MIESPVLLKIGRCELSVAAPIESSLFEKVAICNAKILWLTNGFRSFHCQTPCEQPPWL